jgi:hypothetical protein
LPSSSRHASPGDRTASRPSTLQSGSCRGACQAGRAAFDRPYSECSESRALLSHWMSTVLSLRRGVSRHRANRARPRHSLIRNRLVTRATAARPEGACQQLNSPFSPKRM